MAAAKSSFCPTSCLSIALKDQKSRLTHPGFKTLVLLLRFFFYSVCGNWRAIQVMVKLISHHLIGRSGALEREGFCSPGLSWTNQTGTDCF